MQYLQSIREEKLEYVIEEFRKRDAQQKVWLPVTDTQTALGYTNGDVTKWILAPGELRGFSNTIEWVSLNSDETSYA
jgi:hypothetical protein